MFPEGNYLEQRVTRNGPKSSDFAMKPTADTWFLKPVRLHDGTERTSSDQADRSFGRDP